jgi:RNA polymerase sigma-70 factor (ECF subfamily)
MVTDFLLLTRMKNGDVKAFKSVFDQYYIPLCLYSTCIVGDSMEAEEIVQELFFVFWKNKSRLPVLHSIKGYLYNAVRNESLGYVNKKNTEKKYSETTRKTMTESGGDNDPQRLLEVEELQNLISRTLYTLPERCRKIFNMQRNEGLKYVEIADRLQISVKTVEADMTKALKILRLVIESYLNNK